MEKKVFVVIEDRGCGIKYNVIIGSYRECIEWINYNTNPHPLNNSIRISKNEDDINGNGDYFTYTIEEYDD